jgi:NDP-sugar pyrophosphorylase family protein
VLSIEPEPLGTRGALVHALPRLSQRFLPSMATPGSVATGSTSSRAPPATKPARRPLSGASPRRTDTKTVATERSLVRALLPRGDARGPAWINGGVYAFTRRALEGFASPCSLERDILPALIAHRELRAYRFSGFFIDIGIPESLAAAELVPARIRDRELIWRRLAAALNKNKGLRPGLAAGRNCQANPSFRWPRRLR